MASTFQRTVSWWLPERCTVGFAPSVKTSPVVLQLSGVVGDTIAVTIGAVQ